MDISSVSIVIPAYNCSKTITKVIESALNQTFGHCEVIVVDDGSTDNTAQVIKNFPQVKYIYQENGGPAKARNRGLKESNNEIVFFTDSDCVAHSDWIELAIKHFYDEQVAVVCGSYGIANKESLLARCIHDEILYRHHNLVSDYPKVFGSYNFGIRKKVFLQVGGFNEGYRNASGEDNDLSYKIINAGYKIFFEKDALVDHCHPTALKKYLKEQYRHGFWRVKMYRDHPTMAKGDDYTFWKDIIEVPLVFGFLLLLLASFFSDVFVLYFALLAVFILAFIECIYGVIMAYSLKERIYLSCVMFLRAFARSFGFASGFLYFINK